MDAAVVDVALGHPLHWRGRTKRGRPSSARSHRAGARCCCCASRGLAVRLEPGQRSEDMQWLLPLAAVIGGFQKLERNVGALSRPRCRRCRARGAGVICLERPPLVPHDLELIPPHGFRSVRTPRASVVGGTVSFVWGDRLYKRDEGSERGWRRIHLRQRLRAVPLTFVILRSDGCVRDPIPGYIGCALQSVSLYTFKVPRSVGPFALERGT